MKTKAILAKLCKIGIGTIRGGSFISFSLLFLTLLSFIIFSSRLA